MDKTTAQRLIRDTFKAAFDRKRYRDFINELCNGFDESKAIASMGVPDAFSSHVRSCQRLGTFHSAEGELADVLIVQLTESYKLDRTRTALRDFVAHKLKREESYKEAGLVAFVSPDAEAWRFSYIRMEYETRRDPKTGKIKAEERLTPARRYSYLVGTDEECHTAQSRFLTLLQNTSATPSLAHIEEAFSVEKVTKEFYEQYKNLFDITEAALSKLVKTDKNLHADFKAKNVCTIDFTKKLLGQIVFLYFIQKKGWLGVPKDGNWGDGPRNFLRLIANQAIQKKQCLFNDVLEPLFYDTLATDRGHDAWCPTFKCRIPFLNGGLFEPIAGYDWENTEINFSNSIFTNRETTPAGDIGTGILDVFDRYNFTVNEAEPLEKEVAIDPEMLGKVFENLIEENRRKGLGAFYTPREVVHYMCQESLINYLETGLTRHADGDGQLLPSHEELAEWICQSDQFAHYAAAIAAGTKGEHYPKPPEAIRKNARQIDKLLQDITICDPAIGSGAFPVGMMTEIVRARSALTPYFNDVAERSAYYFKRHAIQNSLYGVDIDGGAVEIAKLRLWLSLVVDEEDVEDIKPLPNLDYKIVCGNSLLGVDKTLFNLDARNRLEALIPLHCDESDKTKKDGYKQEIDTLICQLADGEHTFDFKIYFSEVFHRKNGFDIVIGNPPYISAVTHATTDDNNRDAYRSRYPLLKGAFDIYAVFLLQGVAITSQTGKYSWIIPNRVMVSNYSKGVMDHLKRNGLRAAVDVSSFEVFENTGVYPIILIGSKPAGSFTEYQIAELADLQRRRMVERSQLRQFTTFKDHHIRIASGTTGFQAQELVAWLGERATAGSIPFVVSGSIDRYVIDFCNVHYMKHKYARAYIRRDAEVADSKWKFWKNEKIVIAGMTKVIEAVYCREPLALGVGVYAIYDYGGFDPRFLLAILNSKYLSYYLNVKFKDKHLAGGYLAINKSTIEELPLVVASRDEQRPFIRRIDQIIAAKQRDCEADTTALEEEIDRLVYKLYDLTPEEITIVEEAAHGE